MTGSNRHIEAPLPRCRHAEAVSQIHEKCRVWPAVAVEIDSPVNRIEKILIAERLGEKLDGARLHRRHRHRDVAVTGYEDSRKLDTRTGQLPLEFEPAPPRHPAIEKQATGHGGSVADQKLLGQTGTESCMARVG